MRTWVNLELSIAIAPPTSDGASITPGGVLAIWSAFPDKAFTRRLESVGFAVEEVEVRARVGANGKGKGPRHVIWFARAG